MTAILDTNPDVSARKWVRIAAVIGAVWYAFGLAQFWLAFTTNPATSAMSEAHASAVLATPGVIWLTFAVASAAGLVGAVLLFKGAAKTGPVFVLSLGSALIYYAWVYGLSGTGADRPGEEAIIALVVVAVTTGFLTLSRRVT